MQDNYRKFESESPQKWLIDWNKGLLARGNSHQKGKYVLPSLKEYQL